MKIKKLRSYDHSILKISNACIEYTKGKKSMKQVWYLTRGDKKMLKIQACPDQKLGFLLYALHMDFYTWYPSRDDIIDNQIHCVVNYLLNNTSPKIIH